jgi:hypothetical protein
MNNQIISIYQSNNMNYSNNNNLCVWGELSKIIARFDAVMCMGLFWEWKSRKSGRSLDNLNFENTEHSIQLQLFLCIGADNINVANNTFFPYFIFGKFWKKSINTFWACRKSFMDFATVGNFAHTKKCWTAHKFFL